MKSLALLGVVFLVVLGGAERLFAEDSYVLPPLKISDRQKGELAALPQVFVRQVRLVGNSVFSQNELNAVTGAFINRQVRADELQELRHRLTLLYIDHGYINSGVVIPDQKVTGGVLTLQAVEGALTRMEIKGNQRLRASYLSRRLALETGNPLNIHDLQARLQILDRNSFIEKINADLVPGATPGESILNVRVKENSPYQFGLQFSNNCSPSVGADQGEVFATHRNLTGWGDALGLRYGFSGGLDDYSVFYSLPLNARDTTLTLRYLKSASMVIEEPFDDLNIDSESETYGITLQHPLFRSPRSIFSIGLTIERRHSETFLFGEPFSFSQGVNNGQSDVTVLRFFQDWNRLGPTKVIAIRSVFSLGIDALGATTNSSGPEGRFFAWLGQFQWAGRLDVPRGSQVIFRTDVQLSRDPLLPMEKFSVGGARSVRGYREDLLVRDNGLVTSLEFRVPVFRLPLPCVSRSHVDGMVQVAPFVDWGWAKNKNGSTPSPRTISSVGIGIRWDPHPSAHAHLYWGYALRNVDFEKRDLQDSGIHFSLSWQI